MDKRKTSIKQKVSISKPQKSSPEKVKGTQNTRAHEASLNKTAKVKEYDPMKNLLDLNKMGAAIVQCFIENDTEGALEVIENYLYAVNKTQFLKEANVPRSTVYNFFRRRNPTIKTLAKIMHASAYSSH